LLLPPEYHEVKISPTDKESRLVDTLRAQAADQFAEWKSATGTEKISIQAKILGLIQRLRIISNSFYSGESGLDGGQVIDDNAKVSAIIEDLDRCVFEDSKKGVVIFSQFTSFLSVLAQVIEQVVVGVEILQFTGEMNDRQREVVVNKFNKSREPRVILVSLLAGGCGLSLHHGSSTVFICEPYYNGFIEMQAEERVHRLGQKSQVNVYKYTMENSVETWITALKEKKSGLASALELNAPYRKKTDATFNFDDLGSLFMDHVCFTTSRKETSKGQETNKAESKTRRFGAPRPKKGKI
jgi:SNF2 family DNA or RNA helicase